MSNDPDITRLRRARARWVVAHRHAVGLCDDARSGPSATIRAEALRHLDAAIDDAGRAWRGYAAAIRATVTP
jgi:hypothetical protein